MSAVTGAREAAAGEGGAPAPTPCRFCGAPLDAVFADLGSSPLANSYLPPERVGAMEPYYPLRALVCGSCFLVQLEQFETPARIFSDYAYFSSYSSTWLEHCRRYAEQMVDALGLDEHSHVVELASNDGYLLQYFRERRIPVLGIEPAANVAKVALQKGIPTLVEFFGRETAASLARDSAADLLLGNNVLAHVPDLNDFLGGMKILLKPGGAITMEFPHLLRLIEGNQWDTIYHEHFSYLSFLTVSRMFAAHGLRLYDVQELPTHGGSLRIHGCHEDDVGRPDSERARELRERERAAGYERLETYTEFGRRVAADKRQILAFLIELKNQGRRVVGYGAPAKGNTLLNHCGVRRDFIDYTVDLNPHKQGHFLPGSHIPIRAPAALREDRPDVVLILPWNLRDEITAQHAYIREWGGRFAVRAPQLELLS
ncbi:MAG TPA: class I SAM-dependent methyltransferase [Solirubrobacteraceae bacterium]|nr:class I SAM-dependent methyltransferase [Solirubrobacteraceae bacterium]